MSIQHPAGYAGDLSSSEAYALLKDRRGAALIDVRTQAEWAYVGAPDLSAIGKSPLFLEWQAFPAMHIDAEFCVKLAAMLECEPDSADPLIFLCRSGVRSRHAAIAMTAAGWLHCHNVADGFEGGLDSERHRGRTGGWKWAGLPWRQS